MNRPLVPSFLKKYDQYLLLHQPDTWTARVHLVIYYSLLCIASVALFCLLNNTDPRDNSNAEVPMIFTFLASLIGLIIWLIFLLRFNVFKRFGQYKTGMGIKTFLLFFTGAFFIVLPNYVPLMVESIRANAAYNCKELVKDANKINELLVLKHKNLVPIHWEWEAFKRVPKTDARLANPYTDVTVKQYSDSSSAMQDESHYIYVDSAEWRSKKEIADSLVLLTDSTMLLYKCPDLVLVSAYDADMHCEEKLYSSRELYQILERNTHTAFSTQQGRELDALLKKYDYNNVRYDYYDEGSSNYHSTLTRQYRLNRINNSFNNITDKKYIWEFEKFPVYGRIIFYISFCIASLLFLFRHSTIRSFFLSVLTAIVLMILDGLMLSITGFDELGVLGMILFNYLIVWIVFLANLKCRSRSIAAGIALNLITFFSPLIPLCCMLYYYELFAFDRWDTYIIYPHKETYLTIAEFSGIALWLILLEPVIKKWYRHWYSLPEN